MAQKRKRPLAVLEPVVPPKGVKPVQREAALRTVRPRPLHYEEKIKVLWPGDPDLEKIDGGAFAKWLRESKQGLQNGDVSAVGSCQAEVIVIGGTSKPLPKPPTASLKHPPPPVTIAAANVMAHRLDGKGIQVPMFRQLPKKQWPKQPAVGDMDEELRRGGEAAYIRHRGQTQDELDMKVEYDLDSDDEKWLAKRNTKGSGEKLAEDDLERLIDGFEKAKHTILEQQQAAWKRQASSGAIPPEERPPADLYPAAKAIQDFSEEFPSLTVRAAHNYWAMKAAASKLPLLQRFWYDKPWARLLARHREEAESDSEDDNGIPFQGKDTLRVHHRSRALDMEDVEERLQIARHDLEQLRTIADQVRRREKFKKRQLVQWRTEWRERVFLARKSKSKIHKKSANPALPKKHLAQLARKEKQGVNAKAAAKAVGVTAGGHAQKAASKARSPANGRSKKLAVPLKSVQRTSLGGGIVSAVVDQLRRLGSWSSRGNISPRAEGAAKGLPQLGELDLEGVDHAVGAAPSLPLQPTTRQQEQAALDAAIALSLKELPSSGPPTRRHKQVRFAGQAGKKAEKPSASTLGARARASKGRAEPEEAANSSGQALHKAASTRATRQQAEPTAMQTLPRSGAQKQQPKPEQFKAPSGHEGNNSEHGEAVAEHTGAAGVAQGFSRSLRTSPGKPRGYVEWRAECKHGVARMDRISKLASFLEEHAGCRSEWRTLAKQRKEPASKYEDRLKEAFPFSHDFAAVSPKASKPAVKVEKGKSTAAKTLPPKSKSVLAGASEPVAQRLRTRTAHAATSVVQGRTEKDLKASIRRRGVITKPSDLGDPPAAMQRRLQKRLGSRAQSSAPEETSDTAKAQARRLTRNGSGKEHSRPTTGPRQTEAGLDATESGSACQPGSNSLEHPVSHQTSSSGSDTHVPADSDNDTESPGLPQRASGAQLRSKPRLAGGRLTRQTNAHAPGIEMQLPNVPLEWQNRANLEAPSDVSSFSEGSGPSLFSQPGETNSGPVRRKQKPQHRRGAKPSIARGRGEGMIVAAARQRARRAAGK